MDKTISEAVLCWGSPNSPIGSNSPTQNPVYWVQKYIYINTGYVVVSGRSLEFTKAKAHFYKCT